MADIISGKSRFNGGSNSSKNKKIIVIPSNSDQGEDLDEAQIKGRVKKHRQRMAIIGAIAVVLLVIAFFVVRWLMDSRSYSGYSISASVNRDDTQSASYTKYADGYIRYSNDGAAYYTNKGSSVWNQTYSMQNAQVKICDEYVAIGDINGSSIYIFNKTGMIGSVDTSLSIAQIEVGNQGVVAAVLEDNSANYINMYNVDGQKIYTVKTTLAGDGYPLDICISKDATKLMASYLYVSGETTKTNVVFYNFSDVGQNETERIVGGFNNFDSTIVGDVHFMSDTIAVAVGENIVSLYKIKEYPSLLKEINIDEEIERVFFSDKYIGMVLKNADSGDIYHLVVYDTSGKKVCEKTFNTQYDQIQFDGGSIIMNNATTFTLMNLRGKTLADLTFDMPIEKVIPNSSRGSYTVVNSKYIQSVRLK